MINIKENNRISARELYNGLQIKSRFNAWIDRAIESLQLVEKIHFVQYFGKTSSVGGRPSTEYDLTKEAAINICLISMNISKNAIEIYKELALLDNKQVFIEKRTRKEIIFEQLINIALKDITIIKSQYFIDKYFIDFYIEEYNLAIEYDENYHKKQEKKDEKREREIKDLIGCTFIRVKEGFEHEGLNEIIKAILLKK
jgi:very-short-patch-repair endonuclease